MRLHVVVLHISLSQIQGLCTVYIARYSPVFVWFTYVACYTPFLAAALSSFSARG